MARKPYPGDEVLSRTVNITVNTANPQVLPSRPNRKCVWCFPSGGAATTWNFGSTATLNSVGFQLPAGCTPIKITREDIGPVIDSPLSVTSVTNGTICAVIESFYA